MSGFNTGHTNAYDASNDYGNSESNHITGQGWELKAKKHKTVTDKKKRRGLETSKRRKKWRDPSMGSEGTNMNDVVTRYFNQTNKRKD